MAGLPNAAERQNAPNGLEPQLASPSAELIAFVRLLARQAAREALAQNEDAAR